MRPPWDPALSDGCSVPKLLRLVVPMETPSQVAVCVEHDRAYYLGGSSRDRAIADATLLLGLLHAGMMIESAERYWMAVRAGGKAHWNDGEGVMGRYSDEVPLPPVSSVESP